MEPGDNPSVVSQQQRRGLPWNLEIFLMQSISSRDEDSMEEGEIFNVRQRLRSDCWMPFIEPRDVSNVVSWWLQPLSSHVVKAHHALHVARCPLLELSHHGL